MTRFISLSLWHNPETDSSFFRLILPFIPVFFYSQNI